MDDGNGKPRRGLRRLGIVALALLIAAGGIVGGLLFLSARDRGGVSGAAQGPGEVFPDRGRVHLRPGQHPPAGAFASDPPTSGPHVPAAIARDGLRLSDDQMLQALELGNVVLLYDAPRPPSSLVALARDEAGPFDPDLVASGGAVILGRRATVHGVIALAWRHVLRAADARDPALRRFAEYWLGRGAG